MRCEKHHRPASAASPVDGALMDRGPITDPRQMSEGEANALWADAISQLLLEGFTRVEAEREAAAHYPRINAARTKP